MTLKYSTAIDYARAVHSLRPSSNPSLSPEDYESGILNLSKLSVLLVMEAGDEVPLIRDALTDQGFMVLVVEDVVAAEAVPYMPRYALIDPAIAGGLSLIRKFSEAPHEVSVLAVLADGEPESDALRAGASATLHRPLMLDDVYFYIERFRKYQELLAQSRELFERNETHAMVGTTGRVAAAIAHEIRNPLAVARLNTGMMHDEIVRDGPRLSVEERIESLREIEAALGRIEGILTACTGLARGERPKGERVNFLEVARRALTDVRNPAHVAIELVGADVFGIASPDLLHQVLVNLMNNAVDALRHTENPRVLVRVYESVSEARISVRDNGPGIPSGVRDRIFEPFFSTKGKEGSGLGLAISRQAIGNMGGALTLSSEPSSGACFRVRLRRAP